MPGAAERHFRVKREKVDSRRLGRARRVHSEREALSEFTYRANHATGGEAASGTKRGSYKFREAKF